MGIREALNEKQGLATGIAVAVLIIALIAIFVQWRGGRGAAFRYAWFTVDDGQSWFRDRRERIPPFDHHGRQAVKANVFVCEGAEPFVAYMERYNPEARARIEDVRAGRATSEEEAIYASGPEGMEVRRPGMPPDVWVPYDSERAGYVTAVTCPEGSSGIPREVYP